MQISKGYDSYLDERGQRKAKKLVNIAIYRLFDRMRVRFGVVTVIVYNFVDLFCGPCCGIAIYFMGKARSSKLKSFFFSKINAGSSLQKRRFHAQITHVYISSILLVIKRALLHIIPFEYGPLLIS